jgi:hypothetical protein
LWAVSAWHLWFLWCGVVLVFSLVTIALLHSQSRADPGPNPAAE